MGRFTMAAKQHQFIAEMYETELTDNDRAIYHYQQAADYFRGEESNASANKCMLKVAQYSAQLENYRKAIEIYEEVSSSCFSIMQTGEPELMFYIKYWRKYSCYSNDDASTGLER